VRPVWGNNLVMIVRYTLGGEEQASIWVNSRKGYGRSAHSRYCGRSLAKSLKNREGRIAGENIYLKLYHWLVSWKPKSSLTSPFKMYFVKLPII